MAGHSATETFMLAKGKPTWSALDKRVKRVSSAALRTEDIVWRRNGQTRGTRTVSDCWMLEDKKHKSTLATRRIVRGQWDEGRSEVANGTSAGPRACSHNTAVSHTCSVGPEGR